MSISRKIASVTLSLTTAVWVSGVSMLPVAMAQSTADLQAQIAALLAQIQALQAQLSAQSGAPSSSYNFTRDLTVGSKGDDVSALQQVLISGGYLKIAAPTGYFGSLTQAAVAAWQAAKGVTPSVGYFGPKSRAALAASAPVGGGPVVGGPAAPASGLAVSAAAGNPSGGSLISGSSRVGMLAFNLTAGNASPVTVTELRFKKQGVLSDSAISGAYIEEGGRVLYQYSSISNGEVVFSGLSLSLGAGQNRAVWLSIDPTFSSAGNTVSFSLDPMSVKAVDSANNAVSASGAMVMAGNFTTATVSNPSFGSLTISSSSVGTTVYAGTQGVLVSQWTFSASNNPLNLHSLNFKVVGSANKADLQNIKLFVNGQQVGSTLSSVSSDGSAHFDLASNPAKLQTGTSNVQVYADIMGSPSFNFQFELLNTYDVKAVDTQYNLPVAVTINGGAGVQVTIQQGQITVSLDSGTPTGNLALGGSNSALAKFSIYAAGEAVRVKFLPVRLISTGGTLDFDSATTPDTHLKNLKLADNVGNQIGSTITSLNDATAASGACTSVSGANTTTTNCAFGTSASPINYVVPANTTRVLTVSVDVQSAASFTTLQAVLVAQSQNLQGLTSSQLSSSGAANGSALTLSTTPLTVTKNGSFGNQTYAKGSANVKVGSYVLTASAAEGVNVSNFTVSLNASSSNFQSLKAKVGANQVGTTYPTLTSGNYTFAGNVAVPVGGTAVVDLYADVLTTNTGGMDTLTSWVSCSGTGVSTYSSRSCSGTPSGQTVTVSSGPTLTVSNNNSLASRQVVLGSSGVSLAKLLLKDTAGIEAIRIQTLRFNLDTDNAKGAAFTNLKLYDSAGNPIAGAGPISMTSAAPTFIADFNFGTASTLTVPQGGNFAVELRGDVTPFVVGSNVENATTSVKVAAAANVVAYGQSSNSSATPTLDSAVSSGLATLTGLRSKLNLSGVALGSDSACPGAPNNPSVNRSRTSSDQVTCLKFAADSAGAEVLVNTVSLKFRGAAMSNADVFAVRLIDPSTQTDFAGSSSQNCTVASASCSVTFSFTPYSVSAASTKGVIIQLDSSEFANVAQQYDGMDLQLNATTDVNWGDGSVSGATSAGLALSSDVFVPISLTHIDYQ